MSGDSTQGTFDFGPPRTIQEKFIRFNTEKPEIKTYVVALAFEMKRRGYEHYGISPLWEKVRWHFRVEKGLGEGFKLPNDYRSRYARLIMEEYPELKGFFEIRRLRSK